MQGTISMKLLYPGAINAYNNGKMSTIDQEAYQLCGSYSYHFDHWMPRWAIWMWGMQVFLVNAYILYKLAYLFDLEDPSQTCIVIIQLLSRY